MAPQYGEVRVDYITYTTGVSPNEANVTVPVSGLVNNPTFSGNVIIEGNTTIDGDLTVSGSINASGVIISGITGLFDDGTEALPSIAFASDPDTGIYKPATNEIGISTNASEALRIDATGNVGIGTTLPGTKLEIRLDSLTNNTSAAAITIGDNGNPSPQIYLDRYQNAQNYGLSFHVSAGSRSEALRITNLGNVGIGTTLPAEKLHVASANNMALAIQTTTADKNAGLKFLNSAGDLGSAITYLSASDDLKIFHGGSTAVTIDTDQNVGIGTDNPQVQLDVANSTAVSSYFGTPTDSVLIEQSGVLSSIQFGNNRPGQTGGNRILQYDRSTGKFQYLAGSNGSELAEVTIANNGYVGIGTDLPARELHVLGSSNVIRAESTGSAARIEFEDSNTTGVGVVSLGSVTNDMQFVAGGSERMRIDSAGNVGINTSNPQSLLHVASSANWNFPNVTLQRTTTNTSNPSFLQFALGGDDGNINLPEDHAYIGLKLDSPPTVTDTVNSLNAYMRFYAPAGVLIPNGNVGIGTDNPGTTLTISSDDPRLTITDTDFPSNSTQLRNTSGNTYLTQITSGHIIFGAPDEKMRVQDDGNVGIGTTNPSQRLTVAGGNILLDPTKALRWGTNNAAYIGGNDSSSGSTSGYLTFGVDSERMRIDYEGNVGIGTSSPKTLLDVRKNNASSEGGNLSIRNAVSGAGTSVALYLAPNTGGGDDTARAASIQSRQTVTGNNADLGFFTANGDTPAERMTIALNGNVGIGTSNPDTNLEIDDVTPELRLNSTDGTLRRMSFTGSGSNIWYLKSFGLDGTYNNSFEIAQGNDSRLFLKAGGNVGIGTTNPQTPLHVIGDMRGSQLAGTGNRAVYSAPSGTLTNSSSDVTLKTKVTKLTDQLGIVKQLNPVAYNWIDTEILGEQREIGFIAQEVEPLIPEVIGKNHNGKLSVDYPKITAVLTKALQEAILRIEALEQRLIDL